MQRGLNLESVLMGHPCMSAEGFPEQEMWQGAHSLSEMGCQQLLHPRVYLIMTSPQDAVPSEEQGPPYVSADTGQSMLSHKLKGFMSTDLALRDPWKLWL